MYEAGWPCGHSVPRSECEIRVVHGSPVTVGPISRGSISLVFALVHGEGCSPAHEGIRGVGAPSTRRPCDSGQATLRAHPPIEPARDQGPHRHSVVEWVSWPREQEPWDEEAERAGARTRCHHAAAHRECPRGDGQARRRPPVCRGARRCAEPRSAAPRLPVGAGGGSRPRLESRASGCASDRPW